MATEPAQETRAWAVLRWAPASLALGMIIVAEILIAIPDPANPTAFPYQQYGLTLHILLVFGLLFTAVQIQEREVEVSLFLVALSLAPLIRIFSLSMPRFWGTCPTNTLPWLAVVGIPLLTAAGAVAYVQQLPPWLLGLRIDPWRGRAVQIALGLTGVPLGFLEYAILREQPWIPSLSIPGILYGGTVIFLATGLAEEVIFRGILLRRAMELLGNPVGILFVTGVFTAMHIFFRNGVDLMFVFGVGLLYALFVVRTKSLWGAIMSHTLANVVLYLVAPFVLVNVLPYVQGPACP